MIPVPEMVRLEYLTPDGWVTGHAGIALLDPGRYVERLAQRKKYGRALALDGDLRPTGRVWEPDDLPDPSSLVPPTDGTTVPTLPCDLCGATDHRLDAQCLL